MTLTSTSAEAKYCFTYCGDDRCNCISGQIYQNSGEITDQARYHIGYDKGYKEGFYEGFSKAIEMLDYKPTMPPVAISAKDCFNMGSCPVCNVVTPIGISMGVVCSVPGCPRNAS